ncbi:DUF2281 domain-containing protein [uncultured Hymenobacter sp.]|uniref:type II toxin-antitoxin system VapB family antitoxin n=1 Tax=uncultured Hymenobacter sp. TaxID=170016 RepID=UPI0035CBCB7E
MTHVQEITQALETLPPDLQQEVADFVAFVVQRRQAAAAVFAQELAERRQQGFGRFKGLIEVPDDFNEPLDDFKDYM